MSGSFALPASFAQELLWYLDRATPGMTAYNIARARRLRGPLDRDAMRLALDALVARHEILRTTYRDHDGRVEQVVGPVTPAMFELVDLTTWPVADREAEASRVVRQASKQPFDLARGPLLRALLVATGEEDHLLLLDTHHIASDGWSGAIMFRELLALYAGLASGTPAVLPELPIQYGDFAAWQRETLQGERLDQLLAWWRTQLEGPLPVLELPIDHPRPAVAGFEGEATSIALPEPLVTGLRGVAHRHGASLYMVLLAAYQSLLARWSGQDDVIVGSPIVGRDRPETEALIGYFANTLVLRSRFEDNPSFDDLLRRVRDTALGAFEHQEIPLEKLVLDLQRDGRLGEGTLYRAVFTMLDDTPRGGQSGVLRVEPAAVRIDTAKFDFTLFLADRPEGVSLTLLYRTELFEMATARRFLAQLQRLLEAVVSDSSVRVLSLPLLSATERDPAGPSQPFDDALVPELLSRRAHATPETIAIVADGASLTYGELHSGAEQIARALRAAGVQPGDRVALLLDREAASLMAVQGIWLTGAAYVPLAPDLPAQRLAQLVEQSGAQAVVTRTALRALAPSGTRTVCLDALPVSEALSPLPGTSASGAAYILFTSGSTGAPKGVVVTHANLAHYVQAISRRLGLALDGSTPWSAASVSTLSADLGHTAVFPTLCAGGTLHLVPTAVAMEPARWAAYIGQHHIDLLKITPGHCRALIGEASGAELKALLPARWLIVGGESCPPPLADQVRSAAGCRLLNHYGPTEVTVGACTWCPDEEVASSETIGSLPIGRPLANLRAEVRDDRGMPVGTGIRGELWLAGPQVASGYLGQPALTAERFVVDNSGTRWYRTGDRVRRLANGALEFLGRRDGQVKVRGFRVELEEIERVAGSVPGVHAAAIALHGDDLIGYVVADPAVTDDALHRAVESALPTYMVPRHWRRLDQLPRNANGKLDRAALPTVDLPTEATTTEPQGEVEQALAVLWREVLKQDGIGRDSDFFALGGHSLLAIRLLGRISKQFGVRLPLRALFEAPTIARQAELLRPVHPFEAPLTRLWVDVLKREGIGPDEEFFALGGHSLLAIRLLGRISRQFGVRLPLRALFDHPTIARLAPVIELEVQLKELEGLSEEEAERLLASGPEAGS